MVIWPPEGTSTAARTFTLISVLELPPQEIASLAFGTQQWESSEVSGRRPRTPQSPDLLRCQNLAAKPYLRLYYYALQLYLKEN